MGMSLPKPNPTPPSEDDGEAALMQRVGQRVRAAREEAKLPRRVLSDLSGVSPRYLAQLEAGEGNISIALLYRVASALDLTVEALITEVEPDRDRWISLIQLFNMASPAVQDAAIRILTDGMSGTRCARVCLIGLRGAGKSTLGARLGHRLDVPFVELNREVERDSGMPVEEVMALYGPDGFRKLEAEAIERVIATHDRLILAVAGGIVSEIDTYNRLLGSFHTIWVRASPDEHMSRVRAQGDERPMATNPGAAMDQLRALLKDREALYERAEAQLNTSGKSVEQSLTELSALIAEKGYLDTD